MPLPSHVYDRTLGSGLHNPLPFPKENGKVDYAETRNFPPLQLSKR